VGPTLHLPPIPLPPPLPPLLPEIAPILRLTGDVNAFTATATAELSGSVGAEYRNGNVDWFDEFTPAATADAAILDRDISVDAFFGFRLEAGLGGITGLYVDAGPYIEFNWHDPVDNPPWDIHAGGELAMGLFVDTWFFDVDWELATFRFLHHLIAEGAGTPSILTSSLPDGTTDIPYAAALAATGGTPPYTWTITVGTLPDGLDLSAAGNITGIPTTAGEAAFTVTVTDQNTAQDTAALSITINDPIVDDCATQTNIPTTECQALVALYEATNGDTWTNNTGWTVTDQPCTWYGVTCTTGNITTVALVANSLSGTIPPEVGNLTNLQSLHLDSNSLSGAVPTTFLNLVSLTSLSLRGQTGCLTASDQTLIDFLNSHDALWNDGCTASPDNDDFGDASVLAVPSEFDASSLGATRELLEPDHCYGGSGDHDSVWWQWTAPEDGLLTLDLSGSGFDTILAVYTGATLDTLSLVACDDDSGSSWHSRLTDLLVYGGVTYRIAVADDSGGNGGAIHFLATFTPTSP
jgi:hypothetical protein